VLETGDPATSLRQLLSWSHRQLSPPAAQMFAHLGVHCGPDITVPAAASLAGIPRADAGRALAELADASLASEHRPGRYVMHDLVRGYAAEQARQRVGDETILEAIGRSVDHYLHTFIAWCEPPAPFTAAPPAPGVVPEQLAGEAGLEEWAWAEHQVLLQATSQAAAAGFLTRAWQLLAGQGWFLNWADFQEVGQAVLAAAQAADDQAALGWTHAFIGWYSTFTGAHGDSRAHLRQALEHFRHAGDLPGRAWAHLLAARPAGLDGDWAEAARLMEQARGLFRQAGDRYGEKSALASLGDHHAHLGNYDLARGYAEQALGMATEAGDPTNLAFAWKALGLVHSRLGDYRQAISCYRQALVLAQQRKTSLARNWLASLLADLGDACLAAGDLPAARRAWQQALQIRDELGLPDTRRLRARLEHASPPSRPH
jgi:tetratricopeptide (TPR) repeat protein